MKPLKIRWQFIGSPLETSRLTPTLASKQRTSNPHTDSLGTCLEKNPMHVSQISPHSFLMSWNDLWPTWIKWSKKECSHLKPFPEILSMMKWGTRWLPFSWDTIPAAWPLDATQVPIMWFKKKNRKILDCAKSMSQGLMSFLLLCQKSPSYKPGLMANVCNLPALCRQRLRQMILSEF